MSCRSRPVYAPRQARHPVPTSRRRARSDQAGPRGRAAGRAWHHLPDRGQAATLTADAGATGHKARERGSDERGPRRRRLPDRGQASDDMVAAITWLTGHLDAFGQVEGKAKSRYYEGAVN